MCVYIYLTCSLKKFSGFATDTKHHLNDQNLYGASIKEISNFRNTRKHVGEQLASPIFIPFLLLLVENKIFGRSFLSQIQNSFVLFAI